MVESPFLLIRAALPGMYERGWGRIVNISSVHGLRASPFKSAYVAAKHGLEGLSKVTALEGGPHGVTSNCINPGYVRTPLVEKQIADQARLHGIPESEVVEKVMLTESAIKRLVEATEVASLAGWLVSDSAGMVTGASYTMDGGWTSPMSSHSYRTIDVPVEGGNLRVGVWDPSDAEDPDAAPTALLVHGVTSSHLAWPFVVEALAGRAARRTRPAGPRREQRDRGAGGTPSARRRTSPRRSTRSASTRRSSSATRWARSSSVVLAHLHPERVSRLVLVDGGLPLDVPAGPRSRRRSSP